MAARQDLHARLGDRFKVEFRARVSTMLEMRKIGMRRSRPRSQIKTSSGSRDFLPGFLLDGCASAKLTTKPEIGSGNAARSSRRAWRGRANSVIILDWRFWRSNSDVIARYRIIDAVRAARGIPGDLDPLISRERISFRSRMTSISIT